MSRYKESMRAWINKTIAKSAAESSCRTFLLRLKRLYDMKKVCAALLKNLKKPLRHITAAAFGPFKTNFVQGLIIVVWIALYNRKIPQKDRRAPAPLS